SFACGARRCVRIVQVVPAASPDSTRSARFVFLVVTRRRVAPTYCNEPVARQRSSPLLPETKPAARVQLMAFQRPFFVTPVATASGHSIPSQECATNGFPSQSSTSALTAAARCRRPTRRGEARKSRYARQCRTTRHVGGRE